MLNPMTRLLLHAGSGLIMLLACGQSALAAISMQELEEKARNGDSSLESLVSSYGHLLEAETTPLEDKALYKHYKDAGEQAPRWLVTRLFPDAGLNRNGSRDGGDTPEAAVEIPFTPGTLWTDDGTTVGFTDIVPVNQTAPTSCASSFYINSSFAGPDAWYSFTLDDSYEVAASVCDNATYDSCMGIFDTDLNLVAVNDDGDGCSNFSSELPPCCLPAGTYYLVLDSYGTSEGDYSLSVTFGDVPCVDPCETYTSAISAVTDPVSVTGTTVDAPDVTDDGFGDVGFEIEFTEGGIFTFDACDALTEVNVELYIYDGNPCDAAGQLAQSTALPCAEGAAANPGVISNMNIAAGTYHLMVRSPGAGEGAFAVNIYSPCDAYEALATVTPPTLLSGSNVDGVDILSGAGPDVGYDLVIPADGFYDMDACNVGTTFTGELYLFDGNPCEGASLITSVGWSDCLVFPGAPRIRQEFLTAGEYHLVISDNGTESGNFEITFHETPEAPTTGGPDEAGYGWINSLDADGPAFEWVDISTDPGAIEIFLGDDQGSGPYPLGLDFPFYEGSYSEIYISSNGHLNFLAANGSLSNQSFPDPNAPNATIAMFWDDLDPGDGVGTIHYLEDADNERFIVQFTGVPDYPGPNSPPNTFQAILGSDGSVLIQLSDLQGDRSSATIGIENAAADIGLVYNYNGEGGVIGDEIAILFGQLEGDFLAPVISFDSIPETVEAELPGDHMVTATILDESGVASATLFYQVNNGDTNEAAMSNTEGDTWVGGVPHQEMGSMVTWWIEAVDDSERENTRVSDVYSFEVVSYTWPPISFIASDGLLDFTWLSWSAPIAPELALRWFNGDLPANFDEAMIRLTREHGLDRDQARILWQDILDSTSLYRSFLEYNVYRDDVLIGTTVDPEFYDLPGNGAEPNVEYTYHVRAAFDAGESDPSNSDTGSRGSRPTSGGPDEMGYSWINSHDPEGPAYDWVDISGIGTDLGFTNLDDMAEVQLPWPFPFYDWDYTSLTVSSNGYVTFGGFGTTWTNTEIPNPFEPNDLICPNWDDIDVRNSGQVLTYDDTESNQRFIIQWDSVPLFMNNELVHTFQLMLYEDGNILVQYEDMDEGGLGSSTVGIENIDASIGLQVHFNGEGGTIVDNLALSIYPQEGDFRPPMINFTEIPETMETELPGDHLISATITDASGVASASLHYQINGEEEDIFPMTNTEGDVYEGGIPHQNAGANVVWWVSAIDDSEGANERISDPYSFEVVSFTWPPIAFQATDGLLSQTNMSWEAPVNPGLLAEWFGDTTPVDEDHAVELLMLQGMSKTEALEQWSGITHSAGRPFIEYNVYRNDELIGSTPELFFTDNAVGGSESDVVYDYHVTAVFDAGESDASNVNSGYWGSPPTWGGPDSFGYAWVNSEHPGGPLYDWIDISANGVNLDIVGDDTFGAITLPFEFPFYGEFKTNALVSSNGYLTFGGDGTDYSNDPIMDPIDPNDCIFPFWDDLYTSSGGTIYYLSDPDNARAIIQWQDVPHLAIPENTNTFQVILSASGIIKVQYADMFAGDLGGATVGLENADASMGLQYNFNGEGGLIGNEVAALYTPPSSCEPVDCIGIIEEEPNQGWEDGTYNILRCDDVMCGSLISAGGDTDSDWYLYTHFGGDIELALEVSDFDGRLTLREIENGGAILAEANIFPRCFNEAISITELAGGAYYVVVEHAGDPDLTEPQGYALSLTCTGDPCAGHEPIDCAGTPEAEPNEGWNADPPNDSYGVISVEETVCGTVWAADGDRDMDWYRLELTGSTDLTIQVEIDAFDAALFLTEFDPSGAILYEVDIAPACHPEQLNVEALPAGEYFIVVGHNDLYGVPLEQSYALSLSGELPAEDMCDNYADAGDFQDIFTLEDPAPTLAHHDGTGCPDGVTSPGLDRVLRLVLGEPTDLMISLTAEGEADEVILLVGDCANPETTCGAAMDEIGPGMDGESLEIPGLPAGDYFIVADFASFGETAPFTLQVIDMNSGLIEGRELSFSLKPNYPNPFNPSTKILWVQPELAEATFTVYNLLGNKLLEEKLGLHGAGQHSHVWNASELPSGVYIYTLQVGDFQDTRKAVLLK